MSFRLSLCAAFCLLAVPATRAETIHVYLVGGQSNADGRANTSDLPTNLQSPQADVPYFAPATGNTLSTLRPGTTQFGPEVTFGRSMADFYPGTSDFAIVKYAVGGTNLYSQWAAGGNADPTTDGAIYQAFESEIRAGLAALKAANPTATLVIDGILWVQGESDIDGGAATSAAYGANLTQLITDMRATFSPTAEFYYTRISDNQTIYSASGSSATRQNYQTLRDQQAFVSTTVAGTKMLDIDGPQFTMNSDNLHFNAGGQQAIGNAFASAAQAYVSPGLTATGINWTGGTGSAFATASNWTGGAAPADDQATNYAVFSGVPTPNQPGVAADRGVGGLQFGSVAGWNLGGSAMLTTGSALTVGSTAYVGLDASALTSGTDTISTATVRLGSNQTWLVGTGGTLSVTSAVTGNALTLGNDANAGTVILGGATDNTGTSVVVNNGTVKLAKVSSSSVHAVGGMGLFINGGTVQVTGSNGDQIADALPIVFNGGTFDLNGNTETIAGLSGSGGTVTNTSGTTAGLTVGSGNVTAAFSGVIANSGAALSLTKIGTGTEMLTGARTYTGTTTVSSGTLFEGGTHTGAGSYTIGSGATLTGNGSITTVGAATVTLAAGAKLVPGSSSTTADTLTFKLGTGATFDISAAVAGSATGALTFNIGTTADKLALTTGTLAIGNGVLNWDDFTFTALSNFTAGTYTLFDTSAAISGTLGTSLTGTINGLPAALSLANNNNDIVLTITAPVNSYSWDTNGTAAGSGAATGTWDSSATASWSTDGTGVAAPAAVTTSIYDNVTFSAGSNGTAGTVTVSGTQSANTMTINQGGLTFTGGTIALATGATGLLRVNAGATINSGLTAKTITFGTAGQTLKLGGGSTSLNATIAGTSAAIGQASTLELTGGTYTLAGTDNIGNLSDGSGGLVVDTGAIINAGSTFQMGSSGSGLLVVNGGTVNQLNSSNLVIGRSATGVGRVIVKSGTLAHTSTGSLLVGFEGGNGTLDVQGGAVNVTGTLSLNSPHNADGAGGAAVVNLSGGVTTVGTINFGKSSEFTGVATSGSGALNVKGGTLYVGAGGIVKSGTGTYTPSVMLSGGTVGASANWSSTLGMSLSSADGGVTFKLADAGNTARNITLSGVLSGAGGLATSGAGTLTLAGANTFTGSTVVGAGSTVTLDTAGTMAFVIGASGINNSISGTGTLNLNGTFTFDLSGASTAPSSSWTIVDVAHLTETFGANFHVTGFTENGNVWTSGNYRFDESTGVLSVGAVPEPAEWALLSTGLCVGLLMLRRRRRTS